jgi:uncharacterized protein (DUF1697 family)
MKTNGRYVALLRGINVGGNNIIKMIDLRACCEEAGFAEVATYIQSGNVIFSSRLVDKAKVAKKLEKALSEVFDYAAPVVVLSAEELGRVIAEAPTGFGKQPDTYRYDVLFVKAPLSTGEAFEQVTTKPGVDTASAGEHALYFRRLISKATQSQLGKLVQRPVYKSLTIRNWNTTTKLAELVLG